MTVSRIFRRFGAMAAIGAMAMVLTWAGQARAQGAGHDPDYLTFGAGWWNFSETDGAALVNIEYTDDRRWLWFLQPMTGAFVNSDGSLYGYAGLSADIPVGERFVITPSFAPGLYLENGGFDLGHVVEFRSSLKLAWRFEDATRIGIDINHLSNAGLDDRNPGANSVMLFYSIPYDR